MLEECTLSTRKWHPHRDYICPGYQNHHLYTIAHVRDARIALDLQAADLSLNNSEHDGLSDDSSANWLDNAKTDVAFVRNCEELFTAPLDTGIEDVLERWHSLLHSESSITDIEDVEREYFERRASFERMAAKDSHDTFRRPSWWEMTEHLDISPRIGRLPARPEVPLLDYTATGTLRNVYLPEFPPLEPLPKSPWNVPLPESPWDIPLPENPGDETRVQNPRQVPLSASTPDEPHPPTPQSTRSPPTPAALLLSPRRQNASLPPTPKSARTLKTPQRSPPPYSPIGRTEPRSPLCGMQQHRPRDGPPREHPLSIGPPSSSRNSDGTLSPATTVQESQSSQSVSPRKPHVSQGTLSSATTVQKPRSPQSAVPSSPPPSEDMVSPAATVQESRSPESSCAAERDMERELDEILRQGSGVRQPSLLKQALLNQTPQNPWAVARHGPFVEEDNDDDEEL